MAKQPFVVGSGAINLARRVGPTAWTVLTALAADAESDGGRMIVRASVRSLSASLGLDKDTIGRALARLRHAELVVHVTERFEPGVYRVTIPTDVIEFKRDVRADTNRRCSDLRTRWLAEAAEVGWTARRLVAEANGAGRRPVEPPPLTIEAVVDGLSVAGSTWTRADVLRAICDQQATVSTIDGPRWAAWLERTCDRVIEECVDRGPDRSLTWRNRNVLILEAPRRRCPRVVGRRR
jgi:hypothetical protein